MDLERLIANVDLGGQFAKFRINGRVVQVGLKPENDGLDSAVEDDEDKDFTAETSAMGQESSEEKSGSESALVVTLAANEYNNNDNANELFGEAKNKMLVSEKLDHLDTHYANIIRTELLNNGI